MVKRQRTESTSAASSSSQSQLSPGDSSSAGPLTPSTIDEQGHSSKYMQLDAQGGAGRPKILMRCFLPPHKPISFTRWDDYDTHYQKYHVNRCLECGKNFPSEHYVGLHIAENHDPLSDARRDRGEKTYGCFVEGCEKVCSTAKTRRMHVIAVHQFPKHYDFFIVNDGIDKRNSMLRPGHGHRRRSSAATNGAAPAQQRSEPDREEQPASATAANDAEVATQKDTTAQGNEHILNPATVDLEASSKDAEMDEITRSMSTLKFVPPSVRFGRGRGRGGLARR